VVTALPSLPSADSPNLPATPVNGGLRLTLNSESEGYPATVEMFAGPGSFIHLAIGYLAGSRIASPKLSLAILAGFAGYQVSQAASGESWSRTGGEFLEFTLGFLGGMYLPLSL
jgi:hypothetical protein